MASQDPSSIGIPDVDVEVIRETLRNLGVDPDDAERVEGLVLDEAGWPEPDPYDPPEPWRPTLPGYSSADHETDEHLSGNGGASYGDSKEESNQVYNAGGAPTASHNTSGVGAESGISDNMFYEEFAQQLNRIPDRAHLEDEALYRHLQYNYAGVDQDGALKEVIDDREDHQQTYHRAGCGGLRAPPAGDDAVGMPRPAGQLETSPGHRMPKEGRDAYLMQRLRDERRHRDIALANARANERLTDSARALALAELHGEFGHYPSPKTAGAIIPRHNPAGAITVPLSPTRARRGMPGSARCIPGMTYGLPADMQVDKRRCFVQPAPSTLPASKRTDKVKQYQKYRQCWDKHQQVSEKNRRAGWQWRFELHDHRMAH